MYRIDNIQNDQINFYKSEGETVIVLINLNFVNLLKKYFQTNLKLFSQT